MEEIRHGLAPETPVEVWFQDEMRVGQKNKLTYRWARKGSRPRAAHDQRTQSTYLFGAVCPEFGTGAALVLPFCNSEAMQLHLDEIATKVTPGAHAIIILDQAGWHGAKQLKVPHNISLLPLPPRSPELNSQENIWQFMRQNWLSNRVFKSFDDIVDHCCYAWNTLIDQPWKIMSIARREWASSVNHHEVWYKPVRSGAFTFGKCKPSRENLLITRISSCRRGWSVGQRPASQPSAARQAAGTAVTTEKSGRPPDSARRAMGTNRRAESHRSAFLESAPIDMELPKTR